MPFQNTFILIVILFIYIITNDRTEKIYFPYLIYVRRGKEFESARTRSFTIGYILSRYPIVALDITCILKNISFQSINNTFRLLLFRKNKT